jgi:hypothetical protein
VVVSCEDFGFSILDFGLENRPRAINHPKSKIQNPKSVDPENRFLWRYSRRRLSAEELRDAMLAVSGRLNLESGGPSVMTPVDAELVNLLYKPSQWQVPRDAGQHGRRSIYLIAKRNLRLPFMEAFDGPALLTSCARREASTHAPQALELLNGAISNELARMFAKRLASGVRVSERPEHPDVVQSLATGRHREADASRSPEELASIVGRAYLLALGRLPTEQELAASAEFLQDAPLEEFCLALFNLNDFAYVP